MFILFGVRSVLVLLGTRVSSCEHCQVPGTHQIARRVRKLTLFFVPVLPLGQGKYVDTCAVCGRTIELSQAEAEAATTRT
jgi:hypothetical protein